MENKTPSEFFQIKEVKLIIDILSVNNESSMFVGGVVRDIIIYKKNKQYEVDIATTIIPENVINLLNNNNIKPIVVGLKFGTVSAVINDYKFEITTLRSEIEFKGRHPRVIFTKDWNLDAQRRDFTINAIYLNFDGNFFDPLSGKNDLITGEIKFIGKPTDRISEDPLRIFRYFRFLGQYSKSTPNRDALLACSNLSNLISTLSKNRVTSEFFKILNIFNPLYVVDLMIESGVLQAFFPQASRPDRLEFLYNLENSASILPDPILRLVALIHVPDNGKKIIIDKLKKAFVFTNKDLDKLNLLLETYKNFSDTMSLFEIKKFLYKFNSHKIFFDVLLITWVRDGSEKDYRSVIEKVANLEIPKFPISRKKILSVIGDTKSISNTYIELENWWIESGFEKNKKECLQHLNKLLKNKTT